MAAGNDESYCNNCHHRGTRTTADLMTADLQSVMTREIGRVSTTSTDAFDTMCIPSALTWSRTGVPFPFPSVAEQLLARCATAACTVQSSS